jgi:hypothetical protein
MTVENDPIEEEHFAKMNAIGQLLKEEFAGYGFLLMVFDFGDEGMMNYLSNADREDVLNCLREFIKKNEDGDIVAIPVSGRRIQ